MAVIRSLVAAASVLAIVGLASVAVLNVELSNEASAVGRSLLSSDSTDCDFQKIARKVMMARNEKRFGDAMQHYMHDAMYFNNGKLADITNGRPLTVEQSQCVASKVNMMFHVGDVVTNGDNMAAVSGTVTVNNKMQGFATVFEFHVSSCKIQNEKMVFSPTGASFAEWVREAGCECFPVMDQMGMCDIVNTPTPSTPGNTADYVSILNTCWNLFGNGQVSQFLSNCVEEGGVSNTWGNAKGLDLGDADALSNFFSQFKYEKVSSTFAVQEGNVVHSHINLKITDKGTGKSITTGAYVVDKFGTSDKLRFVQTVLDDQMGVDNFIAEYSNSGPSTNYWKFEDSRVQAGLTELFAKFGFPTVYSNNAVEENYMWWSGSDVGVCSNKISIWVSEMSWPKATPYNHPVFASYSFSSVSMSKVVNASAAVPGSSYDSLTNTLNILSGGPGEAMVDAYIALSVGKGQMSVSEAKNEYTQWFAKIYNNDGELTSDYNQLVSKVCALL